MSLNSIIMEHNNTIEQINESVRNVNASTHRVEAMQKENQFWPAFRFCFCTTLIILLSITIIN